MVLHGLFGCGDNWLSFAREFSSRFRVLLLDARNHGLSPHDPEMSYSAMAEDVREFMEEQGINSAHLLGHSLGSKTAMEFALRHGERVRNLVVVDMAPRAYPPHHPQIIETLCGLDLGRYGDRQRIEDALADAIPDKVVRRFLLKNLARDDAGRFRWKPGLAEIRGNYPRLNEGLAGGRLWSGACLFVRGEHSDYILEQDRAGILDLFPAAEIQTVAGAGHWVHADAPDRFQEVVKAFLR